MKAMAHMQHMPKQATVSMASMPKKAMVKHPRKPSTATDRKISNLSAVAHETLAQLRKGLEVGELIDQ